VSPKSQITELGAAIPGSCYVATDAFGETRRLLCEFSYPGGASPHGVFAVIDEAWHGAVSALTLSDDGTADKRRRRLEKDAKRMGGSVRVASSAEAGALLRDGIASLEKNGPPLGTDMSEVRSGLSMAAARAAILAPGASEAVTAEQRWPESARLTLVDEFLASPRAAALRDSASRMIPGVLAMNCVRNLGCDPTLIGPLVLERLLLDVLPRTLLVPDRFGEAIPPAVEAWTEWLTERNKLPASARKQLTLSTRHTLLRFGRIWYGPDAEPLRRYVNDLSDTAAADRSVVAAVIDRRRFAVPSPADRVTGLVADGASIAPAELDATAEGDRALITALEVSARGLPQYRTPSYVAVTRQLWDNDPPAVWESAQRMRAAGLPRENVLERLAGAWDTAGADDDRYEAALRELS
jgi:hypothetical protein